MVDFAVRPALILGVAWLLARCLSRATPATRHLVWHTAVIASLAAPLLAPLTPKFEVASLPQGRVTLITNEVVLGTPRHLRHPRHLTHLWHQHYRHPTAPQAPSAPQAP